MNRNDKDFQKVANAYAKSVIQSIKDDLDALSHAQECDGTLPNGKPCKRGSETRKYKLKDGTSGRQMVHNNDEAWHDEDAARRQIDESPLSLQVRSGWHSPGETGEAEEYEILLGTGGPAHRIIGTLDRGQPDTARFEYQDWFKPWTAAETSSEQDETLLSFAQTFYFGE
jgi:hypothetical protein